MTEYYEESSHDDDDFDPQASYGGLPAEGPHIFRVMEAVVKEARSGNTMCQIMVQVVDRRSDSFGTEARDWFVYLPKSHDQARRANAKLARFCRAIDPGMRRQSVSNPAGFNRWNQQSVTETFLGKFVVAVVQHYQDTWYTEEGEARESTKARLGYWRALSDAERLAVGEQGPVAPINASEEGFGDEEIPF